MIEANVTASIPTLILMLAYETLATYTSVVQAKNAKTLGATYSSKEFSSWSHQPRASF